jgi:dienelactone hydrolase
MAASFVRAAGAQMILLLAMLPVSAIAQADGKNCAILLVQAKGGSAGLSALGRKLDAVCATRAVSPADVAKQIKSLRQQGAKRVVLVGHAAGANAALAFAGSNGDAEGVIVLGGDASGNSEFGELPELAGSVKQHVPVLWVVGSGDPLHKRGEDYAFAKAPPHPFSRYVSVKADAAGTPEAASKAVLEWLKALE